MLKTNKTQKTQKSATATTAPATQSFTQELVNYFNTNGKPLIGLDKASRKAFVKQNIGDTTPAWVERPSDVPTFFCSKLSSTYKVPEHSKYRGTRGFVQLQFDGKYWETVVVLTEEFQATEEAQALLADMAQLKANGTSYYNVSTTSSERRHCEALAKALALYYKLAFSPVEDVPAIDVKALQQKSRRVEIYKYMSKMVESK
jgi:hypothetical protein